MKDPMVPSTQQFSSGVVLAGVVAIILLCFPATVAVLGQRKSRGESDGSAKSIQTTPQPSEPGTKARHICEPLHSLPPEASARVVYQMMTKAIVASADGRLEDGTGMTAEKNQEWFDGIANYVLATQLSGRGRLQDKWTAVRDMLKEVILLRLSQVTPLRLANEILTALFTNRNVDIQPGINVSRYSLVMRKEMWSILLAMVRQDVPAQLVKDRVQQVYLDGIAADGPLFLTLWEAKHMKLMLDMFHKETPHKAFFERLLEETVALTGKCALPSRRAAGWIRGPGDDGWFNVENYVGESSAVKVSMDELTLTLDYYKTEQVHLLLRLGWEVKKLQALANHNELFFVFSEKFLADPKYSLYCQRLFLENGGSPNLEFIDKSASFLFATKRNGDELSTNDLELFVQMLYENGRVHPPPPCSWGYDAFHVYWNLKLMGNGKEVDFDHRILPLFMQYGIDPFIGRFVEYEVDPFIGRFHEYDPIEEDGCVNDYSIVGVSLRNNYRNSLRFIAQKRMADYVVERGPFKGHVVEFQHDMDEVVAPEEHQMLLSFQ